MAPQRAVADDAPTSCGANAAKSPGTAARVQVDTATTVAELAVLEPPTERAWIVNPELGARFSKMRRVIPATEAPDEEVDASKAPVLTWNVVPGALPLDVKSTVMDVVKTSNPE